MISNSVNNIESNKVIKNTSWMIGERVFQMFISLFVGTITARYLGPANYGLIGYGASYIAFFNSICTLGLDGIIVKKLVDNQKEQGLTLGTGIVMRIISSLIAIISIAIIVSKLNPNNNILIIVTLIQSIALIFRSIELIYFWFQSRFESKYTTIIKTTSYILISIYKIFILVTQKNIFWFAFSNTLDIILISIFMIYSYKKQGGQRLRFSFKLSKEMLSISYHFILSGVMVAIYGQMDKIMLGKMLGTESVGFYSVGITICGLWSFIPGAIIASLRPIIIESREKSKELYEKKLKQLYAIIIWLGLFYALFINIFSKYIVLILYGKEYFGAIAPLNITVWYSAFSILGVARDIWIICEGHQKYSKYFAFIGSMSNLIINIILIPRLGVIGAAIATLITQIITGFLVTLVFKDTRISSKYMIDAFLLKGVIDKDIILKKVKMYKNSNMRIKR